jgi:hypothetical protein
MGILVRLERVTMMRSHYISGLTLVERYAIQERAKSLHMGVDLMPGNDLRIWCYQNDVTDTQWQEIVATLDLMIGAYEGSAM